MNTNLLVNFTVYMGPKVGLTTFNKVLCIFFLSQQRMLVLKLDQLIFTLFTKLGTIFESDTDMKLIFESKMNIPFNDV